MKPASFIVEDMREDKYVVYANNLNKFLDIYAATATLVYDPARSAWSIVVTAATGTLPTSFSGVEVVDDT